MRTRGGGEIPEPFHPDSKDCDMVRWLSKVKGLYHNDFSLVEGKANLKQEFLREHDSAQLLSEMPVRVKEKG